MRRGGRWAGLSQWVEKVGRACVQKGVGLRRWEDNMGGAWRIMWVGAWRIMWVGIGGGRRRWAGQGGGGRA